MVEIAYDEPRIIAEPTHGVAPSIVIIGGLVEGEAGKVFESCHDCPKFVAVRLDFRHLGNVGVGDWAFRSDVPLAVARRACNVQTHVFSLLVYNRVVACTGV